MNKIILTIGLVLLIVGIGIMAAGWSMSGSAQSKVDECNTMEGQIRRSMDQNYQTECEAAVAESNMYVGVCMAGVPVLIVGIILLIFGAVKKDKTAQPAYPPVAYPQPYPPQQAPPPYQPYPQPGQYQPPPPQYPQQQYPPQYPPPPPY